MKKWLIISALAGLVAPLVYLTIFLLTGYTLGEGIFFVWPGSMGLMVLENQPSRLTVLSVWAMLVASNAVLYSFVGLTFWHLSHFDHSPSSETKDKNELF
jgi:hypothetical protein